MNINYKRLNTLGFFFEHEGINIYLLYFSLSIHPLSRITDQNNTLQSSWGKWKSTTNGRIEGRRLMDNEYSHFILVFFWSSGGLSLTFDIFFCLVLNAIRFLD